MQIHEIVTTKKTRKRIGRGGRRGTYSGRGCKGQKARSGGNVDPLFEGGRTSLVQRMKKIRGFKSPHAKKNVISLTKLETYYDNDTTVSIKTLVEKKLIRKKTAGNGVRVVASGQITKKLTIAHDIGLTKMAQKAIESAGGKVIQEKK